MASAARPILTFAGKPPSFTGAGDRNKQTADDQSGWRKVWELCGGNAGTATKRSIEARLTPVVGPLDWGSADADKYLDQHQFMLEVQKLQTATRMAALFWAYGQNEGQRVQVDPRSALMTRPHYNPDDYARTPALARMEAKAARNADQIKADLELAAVEKRAGAMAVELEKKSASLAKANIQRAPQSAPEAEIGRGVDDLIAWKRLFSFVDTEDFGRITKKGITDRVGQHLGSFGWRDPHDTRLVTFEDFVNLMVEVPLEKRYRNLHWAKNVCPDKVYPLGGGRPHYAKDGKAWA